MTKQKLSVNTPIELINEAVKDTLVDNLGIVVAEVADGKVVATMPVDYRTIQPAGILHGGATIALAETVAGLGSALIIDTERYDTRGIQLSTNHISGGKPGIVTGIATLIHRGRTTHLWNVDVVQGDRLVSSIRVTNMIIERR